MTRRWGRQRTNDDWTADRSTTRAASTRSQRRRFAVCLLCLGNLLVVLLLPASAHSAVGTADEIHYTFTGPSSVAFDWRGTATDIRYGATTSYGSTATTHTPTPLPFSSAGPFQEVELTGLTPGATYHYSIGDGPDQTMATAPTRGFRFDVEADVGDSGSYGNVRSTQEQIAADKPAFVIVTGDLSYGNAHGQSAVDQHFNDVMAWSQQAAYMPAWGNHEWEIPAADDLRNYKGRFVVPNPQTSTTAPAPGCCGEDWGWFDAGGVRFISYPEPYASGTWPEWQSNADAIFAAAQADSSIHFIVTYGHRPAYSTGHHPGSATLAGILNTFGGRYSKYVLNLNAHSHDYERFQPINGVTHITAAGGGATLETPWSSTDSRTAFRAMHLEHLRVDVSDSGMRMEAVCGPATIKDDMTCVQGSVIDSYTIGINPPPAPVVDHIVISPASATIAAGGSQAYTAQGFDASNSSLGDVTAFTTFSIGPDGTCTAASCTATTAGAHTVTGNDSGKTSTASLAVTAGALDHLALAPASATIPSGGSQAYTAQGRDQYDNSLGDVTAATTFSIAPDGSCTGATCTASVSGAHTVTGTSASKGGTASLQVGAGSLDHIVISPASATIAAGGSQAYTAQGFDASNSSLGDVTAFTTFSISPEGSCTGATCTAKVGGSHTVTGNDSGKTSTASLSVNFVKNPGFETDTTGWNTSGKGITLARVAGGHTGGWAAQLTNTGASATTCLLNDSPDWLRPTAAGTYTGSIWVRADTAGKPLKLRFREYSISSGALLGTATNQLKLTTAWQQVTVTYTITAPGSTLDFNAYLSSASPGTCFYADAAAVLLP